MNILNVFKTKCPKCGGTNISVIKEGFFKQFRRMMLYMLFLITILFFRKKPDLYVCKDCGFSWEKR